MRPPARRRAAGPGLETIVAALERLHGPPAAPPARGAFEMVLWENVAYLQPDDRHAAAFSALRTKAGTTPAAILSAPRGKLLEVATLGGMHPGRRAERLREVAELTLREFGGDLDAVLKRPVEEARRALKKYPRIGDPGAEKILVFCGAAPYLALDSNGLRALLRLGFGQQKKSYAATYRAAQEAALSSLPARLAGDCVWLARAHRLLRLHGKELCRTMQPRCELCPLAPSCSHYQTGSAGVEP